MTVVNSTFTIQHSTLPLRRCTTSPARMATMAPLQGILRIVGDDPSDPSSPIESARPSIDSPFAISTRTLCPMVEHRNPYSCLISNVAPEKNASYRTSSSERSVAKRTARSNGWPAYAAREVAESRKSSGKVSRHIFTFTPIPTMTKKFAVPAPLLSQRSPPTLR